MPQIYLGRKPVGGGGSSSGSNLPDDFFVESEDNTEIADKYLSTLIQRIESLETQLNGVAQTLESI